MTTTTATTTPDPLAPARPHRWHRPRPWSRWLLAASLAALATGAQALTVASLSPQGEVARVRQVVVKFDSAAVSFGDPKAPAPFAVSCDDAAAGSTCFGHTSEQ